MKLIYTQQSASVRRSLAGLRIKSINLEISKVLRRLKLELYDRSKVFSPNVAQKKNKATREIVWLIGNFMSFLFTSFRVAEEKNQSLLHLKQHQKGWSLFVRL
jgi:hypothetical protein